jgi:hypothetical protein
MNDTIDSPTLSAAPLVVTVLFAHRRFAFVFWRPMTMHASACERVSTRSMMCGISISVPPVRC